MQLLNTQLSHVIPTVLVLLASGIAAPSDQAIIEKMMAKYSLDPDVYEIEILSNPLKVGDVSPDNLTIIPLTQKEPVGLFIAKVKVTENGNEVDRGQVRMEIRQWANVVVLADRIKSRQLLSKDKLTIKRMDITSLHERPLQSIENLEGLRARRNLSKGKILTAAAVEPIPDIEAGRAITIVYVDGLCRITAAGMALQSGMAGEYIKVKNKASNKTIIARVVDKTVVAVDP
ncbi:MAG: flagellar basal body P-ring formation chaperone FlgA [Candidatus Zixiibacteriota bacterium]